jgi:polar amino acid transport system substrate-binding protein/two-component system sensor histidine kinase EvgS
MKTDQVLFEIGVRRTGVAAITLLAVLFLVSEAFGAKPAVGSETEPGFKLSADEMQWIEAHPVIRIGVDRGFAPFEFVDKNGEYSGMAAGYLDIIEKKTGLKFEVGDSKSWSECIDNIKHHRLDLLPCVGDSSYRGTFLTYSDSYLQFSRVIVAPMDSGIETLEDLSDLKVAVQKNSSHHMFLKENSSVKPQLYDSFEDAMLAVAHGKADAVIGNLAVVSHLMKKMSLTNIKLAAYLSSSSDELYFGVRNDWPELVKIINHVLESITIKQSDDIISQWITLPANASASLDLTPEERKWLLDHPRIRVGWDSAWAPIEYVDENGIPSGISIDYLNALQKKLGVHFDMGEAISWQEVTDKSEKHEIDILSCVAVSPQREQQFNFTESYLDIPIVIFGRDDMPYIRGVSELEDFRVAVIKDYYIDYLITRDFPKIKLIRTENMEDAFSLLDKHKVSAFVGNVVVGNYYLSKNGINDIKIIGETHYSNKQCVAVRKDWPQLVGIIQKALDTIPESERTAFYRKWVWINYEYGFDYYMFSKIVMGMLIFVLLLFYWNRRLSSEVKRRREVEAMLSASEDSLRKSLADLKELEAMKDDLTHMVVHDMRTPLTSISWVLDIIGYDVEKNGADKENIRNILMAKCSTQELIGLVQSLLDINRFESHRMPVDFKKSNLRELAEQAICSAKVQADYNGLQLLLLGEAVEAEVDVNLIHRILVNLIINAVHASPEKSVIEVNIYERDSRVFLEVRDEGHGIPEEFKHTVFEKFASLAKGKNSKAASIGLGLTFCKLAVEAHKGCISVHDRSTGGSILRIELPKLH